MGRSLRVQGACLLQVKESLKRQGYARQQDLAEEMGISRSTLSNYLNGRSVDYQNFMEISDALVLDWQAIADFTEEPTALALPGWGDAEEFEPFVYVDDLSGKKISDIKIPCCRERLYDPKKNLPVFFRWSFQEESKSIYGQKAIYFQESQYHVYYSRFDLDGTFDPGYSVIQKNPSHESDFYDSSRYSPRIQWRKGNSIIELKGHQAGVAILDIQDKYIVSGGINGMVLIHDKNTGNIVAKLKGDESEVIAVSEINGDNHVLVASMDGVIREWGLNGKLYHELRQNREKIKAVSFSPSGKYIVAVSLNQTYLWEKSGQLTSVLKGTSPQVNPMVNEVLPELNSMESQVLTRSSH